MKQIPILGRTELKFAAKNIWCTAEERDFDRYVLFRKNFEVGTDGKLMIRLFFCFIRNIILIKNGQTQLISDSLGYLPASAAVLTIYGDDIVAVHDIASLSLCFRSQILYAYYIGCGRIKQALNNKKPLNE